jgi:hypothetical protein
VIENQPVNLDDPRLYEDGAPAAHYCPEGCGCRVGTEDADRFECGCDGPCTEG